MKAVVLNVYECLPYKYSQDAISHYGDLALVVRDIIELSLMRKSDATSQGETAVHYLNHFSDNEMHDRFSRLSKASENLSEKYRNLADELYSKGLPDGLVRSPVAGPFKIVHWVK